MRLDPRNLTFVMAITAALTAMPIGPASAQAPSATEANRGEIFSFELPAQPLDSAVLAFSKQSGIQLVFDATLGGGARANAVEGKYTVREALDRLLAGTGLGWRFLNKRTVTIEAKPATTSTEANFGIVQVAGANGTLPDLNGFGPGVGANGSSDVTATEGTGSLTTNGTTVASKGPLSLKDTPQTVNVMTQAQIEQQNFTDLQSALLFMPGITIAQNGTAAGGQGTDAIISRGYQIQTISVDGGGPLALNNPSLSSGLDLAEFDHIELLQGSAALFGGDGNPGGVISLTRKRPLDHGQVTVDAHYGSWDDSYLSLDATSPLGFDGHLRGRVVVDYQYNDFFYDVAHQTRTHIYGVSEADLGPDTMLRVGSSYGQQSDPGTDVQGLPRYENGADLYLPRSTCLCAPWNSDDSTSGELFGQLDHRFSDHWSASTQVTHLRALFNTEADQVTPNIGTGATSTPIIPGMLIAATGTFDQLSVDAHVDGSVSIFGLPQRIVLGYDYSTFNLDFRDVQEALTYAGDVFNFNPSTLMPQPALPVTSSGAPTSGGSTGAIGADFKQSGFYLNLLLNPIKELHVNAGFRYSNFENSELSSREAYTSSITPPLTIALPSREKANGILTPQASVSYDITHHLSAYVSYADIYSNQSNELTASGQPLGPVKGKTFEGGFKWSNGKINASAIAFYSGEFGQGIQNGFSTLPGCCYEQSGTTISKGIQLSVAGEILPRWNLAFSYTYDDNYNEGTLAQLDGATFTSQQPFHQGKIWTSYILPGRLHDWTVGGGFRLESSRFTAGTACTLAYDPAANCIDPVTGNYDEVPFRFTQALYTVLDLQVGYHIDHHWSATATVKNVADTRYYATAGTPQGGNFYGPPREFMLSVHGSY